MVVTKVNKMLRLNYEVRCGGVKELDAQPMLLTKGVKLKMILKRCGVVCEGL